MNKKALTIFPLIFIINDTNLYPVDFCNDRVDKYIIFYGMRDAKTKFKKNKEGKINPSLFFMDLINSQLWNKAY